MRREPARTLAAAGTAGTGAAAAAGAYVVVRGLPGLLYAAGICLAAFVGAVAIVAGRTREAPGAVGTRRPPRWRRRSRLIAQLQNELATTVTELEEHRRALANLAAQLSRESQTAHGNAQKLEQRICELEAERDGLLELVTEERESFHRTLDELGGGIGRHDHELAELERELEALLAR